MEFDVNYLAILAAAVSSFIIGFLWYGPLFGKSWIRAMGWADGAPKMKHPWGPYLISFIAAFIMAAVLAHILQVFDVSTLGGAVETALWVWVGFIATVTARSYAYGKKNALTLWLLDGGYILIELVVMASIVTAWM